MMMWNRSMLLGVAACAVVICAAPDALAQVERPQRASHGLFGGPAASPNSPQQLDITASLFGAYDDDVTAEQGGLASAAGGVGGVYSGLTAGLSYGRRLSRSVSFGLSAGSSVRYYPSLKGESFAPIGEQVGAGFTFGGERNTRNKLSIGGDLAFAPYYSLSLVPAAAPIDAGDLAPQAVDSVINKNQALSYGAGATLEHALGARSSLIVNGGVHTMDFQEESRRQSSRSVGAHFRRNLTKDLGLKFGYERADATFGGIAGQMSNHIIDAGLDFLKPLSLTRHTSLTFSIGPSMYEQNNIRQYRAVGDAALNHEIGRTWSATANYHRGVGFVAGLNSAVFSDSWGGSIGGLLNEWLDFRAMGSYSTGEFAITGAANTYDTYQASARLRAALQQSLALYVEYVAYRYEFDSRANLPAGIPGRLVRQGVRTGLTLWLPLIR
jgi:hypothetical protein